jgi:hypothetical protein
MAGNSRQMGADFWYDFDNQTLLQRTREINDAITRAYRPLGGGLDSLPNIFESSYKSSSHPAQFLAAIAPGKSGFVDLAAAQRKIVSDHFGNDMDSLKSAFQDFGQGVLYDPRAPRYPSILVHMIDGSPDDWVGYRRWHAFVRAAMFSGADAVFWLQMLRFIALAWGIQTEMSPTVDAPNNPPMAPSRLQLLTAFWTSADIALLDKAFVTFKQRAPTPEQFQRNSQALLEFRIEGLTISKFDHIKDLLNRAADNGHPRHGGRGRFWNVTLPEFMQIGTIYGVQLIADTGPQRGARSGLIKALRGQAPFGDGGFPRMPMDRPPVPDPDIAFIESWIDGGCKDEPMNLLLELASRPPARE